jgi:hypothetical protein
LDLSELTFLDSSGIRAILRFADFVCPKGVFLRNPSESVRTVLGMAGVEGLIGVTVGRQRELITSTCTAKSSAPFACVERAAVGVAEGMFIEGRGRSLILRS